MSCCTNPLKFERLRESNSCATIWSRHSASQSSKASLDDWGEREEQFLNERVERYLSEDGDLRAAVQADPQLLLLYCFLSGYTRGQLREGSLPMKEFADSPTSIREAVLGAKR